MITRTTYLMNSANADTIALIAKMQRSERQGVGKLPALIQQVQEKSSLEYDVGLAIGPKSEERASVVSGDAAFCIDPSVLTMVY